MRTIWKAFSSWWKAAIGRRAFEAGMAEEMEFHLEQRTAHLVRGGMEAAEARRHARMEFGSVTAHHEECRQARGLRLFDEVGADLRYALRMIRNKPGGALIAVLFLGVAIGVNTSLFSFVNAYMIRPLPVAGAERHVDISAYGTKRQLAGRFAKREFEILMRQAAPVAELYTIERATAAMVEERPVKASVEMVSVNFLTLLKAPLMMGRPLEVSAQEPEAVLSHAGWSVLLGSHPSPLGKRIRMGRGFFVIVGVTDASFTGVEAVTPDVWVLDTSRRLVGAAGSEQMQVGGILRRDVDVRRAQAVMSGAMGQLNEGQAEEKRYSEIQVTPRAAIAHDGDLEALGQALVAFAFALLLVVACANLASLHLAGAQARQKELAIRLSLGASRFRVVRQLLTEALVLAAGGAVVALCLVWLSLDAVQTFLFQAFHRLGLHFAPAEPDWRVFLFAAGIAVVSAIAFGLLPALEATKAAGLVAASRQQDGVVLRRGRPSRLRQTLIAGQTAANIVLLLLAGILVTNAYRFENASAGYALATLYDPGFEGSLREYERRISGNPNIAAVSGVGSIPLRGVMYRRPATVDGADLSLAFNYVDHRYFDTMQIPLVRGRGFQASEAERGATSVIVSEATARRLWPGRDAIGQTILTGGDAGEPQGQRSLQVVGVAKDVTSQFFFVGNDPHMLYLPAAVGSGHIRNLVVRARRPDPRLVMDLQLACLAVDAASFCEPLGLEDIAWLQRFPVRMASYVAMALGGLALVLSCVGLYGVVSFLVLQRTREAGIRLALGASRWGLMREMAASPLRGVAVGMALGWPLCFAAGKMAEAAAVFLRLTDAAVFVAAPGVLLVVALAATSIPARRAAKVDPAMALRQE